MPSFKNKSTGQVVTFDDKTGTAADRGVAKASIADLSKSDRWEKVADVKPAPVEVVVELPDENAAADVLRAFALKHASDDEKAALELMDDAKIKAFVFGAGDDGALGAGPAAGV